jgi:hypothetical protein
MSRAVSILLFVLPAILAGLEHFNSFCVVRPNLFVYLQKSDQQQVAIDATGTQSSMLVSESFLVHQIKSIKVAAVSPMQCL